MLQRVQMPRWLEFLAYFDLVDPIEGFISTFHYADWKGSYQRAGIIGVIAEFFASLAALNCWTIWMQRDAGWTGVEAEQLLFRHGVRIWGRGFLGDQIYFRVKQRQVVWAEYLLLRAGVPVTSSLVDSRNAEYAHHYPLGSEPPARNLPRDSEPGWIDQILALFR
jgi:hypothetical protein